MATYEELQKKNEQLIVELAVLRKSNTELEQQRDAAQAACRVLKESDGDLRGDRKRQQALLDKRQGRIQVLEQQLQTARTENAMLRKSRNDADDAAGTTAVEELHSALDKMRAQWNIAVRAATAYQQDIERLNRVIADLKTEHHLREALDETWDTSPEEARFRIEGDGHIIVDTVESEKEVTYTVRLSPNSVILDFEVLREAVLDEAKFRALRAKLQGALASVATESQAEAAGDGN